MSAVRLARTIKDIFGYALNINSVREFAYSVESQRAVEALSIKFVDALDDADNVTSSFYIAMRDEIRRVFTVVALETYLNPQDDEAFFRFQTLLENSVVADGPFMGEIRTIREEMADANQTVMADA